MFGGLCLIVTMRWDAGRGLPRATYCAFTVGTNNGLFLHNSIPSLGTLLTLLQAFMLFDSVGFLASFSTTEAINYYW